MFVSWGFRSAANSSTYGRFSASMKHVPFIQYVQNNVSIRIDEALHKRGLATSASPPMPNICMAPIITPNQPPRTAPRVKFLILSALEYVPDAAYQNPNTVTIIIDGASIKREKVSIEATTMPVNARTLTISFMIMKSFIWSLFSFLKFFIPDQGEE